MWRCEIFSTIRQKEKVMALSRSCELYLVTDIINIKHLAVWGELGLLNQKISFEKFFWPRFVNRTFIYTIQGAGTPYILLNVAQFEDAAISVSTEWLCTCMISEAMIYSFDLYTFISVILNCFVVLCVVLELEWTRRHISNSCTYPNLCSHHE